MVTADGVKLYPNDFHNFGLRYLRKRFNEIDICKAPTEEIITIAEFLLKNNYFEFIKKFCWQILRAAIGTEFAPPYACIFMDEIEASFLKTQQLQPFFCLDILMTYFLYGHVVKKTFNCFSKILNSSIQT